MKTIRIICLLSILLVSMVCCHKKPTRYQSSDPFYSYYNDIDLIRFPLIKPYEVTKIDDEHGWSINLSEGNPEVYSYSSILNIKYLAIADGTILVKSDSDIKQGLIDEKKIFSNIS